MARPTYNQANVMNERVLLAMQISGQNPDGSPLETVDQSEDGQIINYDIAVGCNEPAYLIEFEATNAHSGARYLQIHDSATAPTDATTRIRSYRVTGAGTDAPGTRSRTFGAGGLIFEAGISFVWASHLTDWAPVGATNVNEIDFSFVRVSDLS